MPSSSARRTARWRRRLAGLPDPEAPRQCEAAGCGRMTSWGLCSRCWLSTDEGRQWERDRKRAQRERKRGVDT